MARCHIEIDVRDKNNTAVIASACYVSITHHNNGIYPFRERWSHFLRQPVKVDSTTQRTIHHEDAETIFG